VEQSFKKNIYNLKASPFRAGMAKAYKPCKNNALEPGMMGSWGGSGPLTAPK